MGYKPTNKLTQDDCWDVYEHMDASDRAMMKYYTDKLIKRVPKLGIKGAVELVFKVKLHEAR